MGTEFWTLLFAATSFGFFILHRDKKKTNELRNVKANDGWTLQAWMAFLSFINISWILI